jgi:tetratricopeptide (TPR) repeat protein
MMSIPQAFAMAWQSYQAGNLQQAELILRQILQADANQVDALHLLGVIAIQTGHANLAVDYLEAAVHLRPNSAEAHNHLGVALQQQGKLAEAALSHRQALHFQPNYAEAHSNLGKVLQVQGKLAEAALSYQEAVRLRPDFAELHYNLGVALLHQGKLAEAVASLETAVHLRPDFAAAHNNLGNALQQQGKSAEAVASLETAVRLQPDFADAHTNLGNALQAQGKLAAAVASYERALHLGADSAEIHNNLGNVLQQQGKLNEAVLCYQEALRQRADYPEALNNLGIILQQEKAAEALAAYQQALRQRPDYPEAHRNVAKTLGHQGRTREALACFERALVLKPDFVDGHYNRSLLWLLQGNFEQGWPEYEWRWQLPHFHVEPFSRKPEPKWDGGPLDAKTLLLCAEQGLGDTLQFIRYVAVVKERGATVVFESPPALLDVLAGYPGIDQLLPQGSPLPACDARAALLSLPGLCGTTLDTIPARVPYLVADRSRVTYWQQRLADDSGFKVGICWQGNPGHKNDRQRSVPLAQFGPLAEVPGFRLICLQKGAGREQWDTLAGGWPTVNLPDQAEEPAWTWVESAALVCALDLVITVDTAVAHLAGALGVPVWVALPFSGDWRWLLEREDSPWYPSMRLFRQTQPGDWPEVFRRIKAALQERLASLAG